MNSDYSWLHTGTQCRWNDPGINDYVPQDRDYARQRIFTVIAINGNSSAHVTDDDDIVLIACEDGSEAEVPPYELVKLNKTDTAQLDREEESFEQISDSISSNLRQLNRIRRAAMAFVTSQLAWRGIKRIMFNELNGVSLPTIREEYTLDSIEFTEGKIDVSYSNEDSNGWDYLDKFNPEDLDTIINAVRDIIKGYENDTYTVLNGEVLENR